jgi:hypothetical protein
LASNESYQKVNLFWRISVSEHQAEPTSGVSGSSGPANPNASGASSDLPITSLEPAIRTEAPDLVPDHEAGEASEAKTPEIRAAQVYAPGVRASEVHASEAQGDTPNSPYVPGKLMIMSPGDRGWTSENVAPEVEDKPNTGNGSGKRRFAAMAAVAVLAMAAGAIGGAVATAGFGHTASFGHSSAAAAVSPVATDPALAATVARIDSDLVALKASVEHSSKTDVTQFNKTSERLDKLEKAQAEPAAKLAKLSEAVEKLHAAAPVAAAAQPAPKEVTGSVTAPATVPAAVAAAPKPNIQTAEARGEFGRLPTLNDWVIRDVGNGGALIEGRRGMFEVYAGDPVPGLGRVEAIRRQDGRWVVVTSRGLIVAR